ncbi:MAG: DUF167 domain-containing protein [Alphaproteobacteria bacterium]|nr:DUF167 domain-containing protein [Alphaproteobacteria bacterium]MBU1526688.1 DUF167 domain-containing protein [Alphaproteobacteria bacterium]MBU2117630.1 DUF167 domain-containing protein [Alphaproteobacteria bacterium]MBU2350196.1 DUF167 domain-containing protein [Alphaproteobacteria bacterium]MBU2383539.1 DUF167 domain-containing protein [Alphaproteobacteria bacterium]
MADEAVVLAVVLKPGAARDEVDGWDQDAAGRPVLRVRVRARPVEGQANDALVRLIAGRLELPVSAVTLAAGGRGRSKRLHVRGLDAERIRRRLTDL